MENSDWLSLIVRKSQQMTRLVSRRDPTACNSLAAATR